MGGPSEEITLFLLDDLDNGTKSKKKEKPFSTSFYIENLCIPTSGYKTPFFVVVVVATRPYIFI